MAFNMKKPSIIKGSVAHKKELKLNRAGYENLPDGRSKSSAFQQNGDPVDPNQMTVEDQIKMADKQFEGGGASATGDYYDSTSFATDYVSHGMPNSEDNWVVKDESFEEGYSGTKHYHTGELHPENFYNDMSRGRILQEIRRQHGQGSQQEKEYNKTFYGTPDPKANEYPDPNRIQEYVMKYNNWLGVKSAMNENDPGSGDDFTFQEYQQKIADANQKREAEKYNKENPVTFTKRVNPMGMSDKDMAVELVASGKFKTIQEAMNAVQK